MSDSVRPHRRQPTRLSRPWDAPGKNTGVGCHFLLQCMRVKSKSQVAQSCLTLCDPMDCSLPGSSVHGIFQARVLEWVAIAFSGHGADWSLIQHCLATSCTTSSELMMFRFPKHSKCKELGEPQSYIPSTSEQGPGKISTQDC